MNILGYVYIEGLINNPSGVGRVVDQLVRQHQRLFPQHTWRFLVNQVQFDAVCSRLNTYWAGRQFAKIDGRRDMLQLRWVLFNREKLTRNFCENDIIYCPAEAFVPKGRGRSVCTIHDLGLFEPDLFSAPSTWLRRLKMRMLFARMVLSADAVVTVSEFSASRIRRFFPRLAGKLHVVYNAAPAVFGQPVSRAAEAAVRKLVGRHRFVFKPGGMNYKKNSDLVMRAWPLLQSRHPGVKLVVCGIYREDEIGLALARAKFGDALIDPGYVPDEVLNALYHLALVVWVPSKYEGFGMPALEAMACGSPVVVSRAGALPEVVSDAAIICGRDVAEEHVEALSAMLTTPTLRADYVARGFIRSGCFSWERSAQQLEAIFCAVRGRNT